MKLKFEWDDEKDKKNIEKHGISFEEAQLVFYDPKHYELYDEKHSIMEKRWIVIGLSGWKILKVSFTERRDHIRIISAKKADKNYEEEYFYGYN